MKSFAKLLSLFCTLCIFLPLPVFAEQLPDTSPTPEVSASSEPNITPSPEPSATPSPIPAPVSIPSATELIIDFTADPYRALPSVAYFELYSLGGTLLDYTSAPINDNVEQFSVSFHVPAYELGTKFLLKLSYGLESVQYYDTAAHVGETVTIDTYYYYDENHTLITGNRFAMTAYPDREKQVNVYVGRQLQNFTPRARMIDGTLMVPVEQAAPAIGITDVTHHPAYNSVRVAVGNKEILFNLGTSYTTRFGKDCYTAVPTQVIDGGTYVPMRFLAEAFRSDIQVYDHGSYMDVMLSTSRDAVEIFSTSGKEKYVNNAGLTSQTNYLIWISKANYEVNVFARENGIWKLQKVFPCTIGTDATPTCVGTYRYYEKIARWNYPEFYVGPVMRFNGGYAIHSTLLKYDGTNYNAAVGKKLSHGCVRIRPNNMNWMIETIPMYTTVHVTNE